jgi:glutathione synthase/RimK-type ligase-like ATP-grasp enzyme
MTRPLTVTDRQADLTRRATAGSVLTPEQYFAQSPNIAAPLVLNRCGERDYLSRGYYVSLIAEARGSHVLPSADTMRAAPLPSRRPPPFALRAVGTRPRLAILHDPAEALPPSCPAALRKFVAAGHAEGFAVELITREDLPRLAAFDALFLRATTGVDHFTYDFAASAAAMGCAVIDSPHAILRCCNKVYLAELFARHGVPVPPTRIVGLDGIGALTCSAGRPLVLKQPDGCNSRGTYLACTQQDLASITQAVFQRSALMVVQDFVSSAFDWRIGVLDGRPLYACRYFMADGHWQITHHAAPGVAIEGRAEAWPIARVPEPVMRAALAAASLLGAGLYGVDIKQTGQGPLVIEVNDNPSLESGIEDAILGDRLYRTVIAAFRARLQQAKQLGAHHKTGACLTS